MHKMRLFKWMGCIRWLFMAIALVPYSGWATDVSRSIVVPSVVKFADLRLKLTQGARKRIQVRVNQLTQSKKLFSQIVERTHLFFPFIEKTLSEENVPKDFKFQALHESMLIGDVVSPTNDVGFWQIHRVAALELKLPIGYPIDERMHLIESTKAAARFLKSHYNYFDSWLGAMLAYNRGRAGVVKLGIKKYYSAKVVWLNDKTDNYILSVIATKLAFEKVAGKKKHATWQLWIYNQGHHGHKLQDIATYLKVEEQLLSEHNRWLKTAIIPHNTKCSLVVPLSHTHASTYLSSTLTLPKEPTPKVAKTVAVAAKQSLSAHSIDYNKHLPSSKTFPAITFLNNPRAPRLIKANGTLAIIAEEGDTITALAGLAGLTENKFLLINEMDKTDQLIPGSTYYCSAKGSKGGVHYHVVAPRESVWDIAQRYGMQQAALLEKNRMKPVDLLQEGQILWLRFIRPRNIPVEFLK